MEISFASHGDIQVVTIAGVLKEQEGAAVRFKLEQKINQGRAKVLFDLTTFTSADTASRNHIINVFAYALMRGTLAACCGLPAEHWPHMLVPGPTQIKFFISRPEAIDYLTKNVPPQAKKADPGQKKPNKEDDIKSAALQSLLQKYEVFQHNDNDDPFRLDFMAEQYKTHPTYEALAAERKAKDSLQKTTEEVEQLNGECDNLAGRVKSLMQMRKVPLSGKELELKHKTLTKEIEEGSKALQTLRSHLIENTQSIQDAKDAIKDTQNNLARQLKELEQKLEETARENDSILANLKNEEAQELAVVEKLKKQP